MQQRRKLAPQKVERRLLTTLQNWVESVFFPLLIEKMEKNGIKEGSLTAKVTSANLLQHAMVSSFTIPAPTTSSVAYIYYTKATLSSLWELTTPSGTVSRTIHFMVRAEVCLANWKGVTDFEVANIMVEGSDFQCTTRAAVVQRKVFHSDIRTQGKNALSLMKFDEDAVKQIAYFLLLHFFPPIYNFLSQKAAEIENALIHTLTTLPPLSVEFLDGVYTYKMQDVSRRTIKTFVSKFFTTKDSERSEDELTVTVEGVWKGDRKEIALSIRVVVFVTLVERRSGDGEANMVGRMKMGIDWSWAEGFTSPPQTVAQTHLILEMGVENTKKGIEQFFAEVVEAINAEKIGKLLREIPQIRQIGGNVGRES